MILMPLGDRTSFTEYMVQSEEEKWIYHSLSDS